MLEVDVAPRSTRPLATIAGPSGVRYARLASRARAALRGRTLWHVNSTAEGGGVAELLRANLGYLAGDRIGVRWLVVEGDPEFFRITKRIHNRLHGVLGDGGPLGEKERQRYDAVVRREGTQVLGLVRPGDVVVVHDPQPLGLIPALRATGARVIWTCHVGTDVPNDITRSAWAFLLPDATAAEAATFTRAAYAWEGLEPAAVRVIPPCIDPLSPKNAAMDRRRRATILRRAGLLGAPDGATATVPLADGGPAPPDAPIVVQVSRWDRLKDPLGVIQGFVGEPRLDRAHLLLAGPAPDGVADDPESDEVLRELRELRAGLEGPARERVHLANLPTEDVVVNAELVNALQRRADVVVQKSLAEGFGLTVTEAMWKARPVVAGGVGGIRDQIEDGVSGRLVDPRDLETFGAVVADLLADPALGASLGEAARRSVADRSLPTGYLGAYLELVLELLGAGAS